jgi:hypothetical protein
MVKIVSFSISGMCCGHKFPKLKTVPRIRPIIIIIIRRIVSTRPDTDYLTPGKNRFKTPCNLYIITHLATLQSPLKNASDKFSIGSGKMVSAQSTAKALDFLHQCKWTLTLTYNQPTEEYSVNLPYTVRSGKLKSYK